MRKQTWILKNKQKGKTSSITEEDVYKLVDATVLPDNPKVGSVYLTSVEGHLQWKPIE